MIPPVHATAAPPVSARGAELARLTPALVAVGILVAWSASSGGFPQTRWYPGAITVLLLLGAAIFGRRVRWSAISAPVRAALIGLALYTAWSYASIAWADAQGVAWDGANRTLLYLLLFGLLAAVRVGRAETLLVVAAWTLALIALALLVVLRFPDPVGAGPLVQGPGVSAPTGYTNAQACMWLMAGWSALVLGASRAAQPALRAALIGGAVLLVDLALLSESRGSLIAGGICAVLLITVFPHRLRSLVALALVGAGVATTAPHLLDVASGLENSASGITRLAALRWPIIAASLATGLAAGAVALLERHGIVSPRPSHGARRAMAPRLIVPMVTAGLVAAAIVGHPASRIRDEWRSCKRGTTTSASRGTPLSGGFGGARYDYYRVSLDLVREHPLLGIGADNFAQDYLAQGRALEAPAYVHSLELRALVHTGIIGTLLLVGALTAALAGAWRGMRSRSPAAATASAAATLAFAQWAVQGSADWFWEIPALGGAAFALLGVACAASPPPETYVRKPVRIPIWPIAGVVAGALAIASLALPWLSAIEVSRGARVWEAEPAAALRQLDLAARLNRLSPDPQLNEGTIALRIGRTDRARKAFTEALQRDSRNEYATLMLGVLAFERGQRQLARTLLQRAVALNPQDGVAIAARDAVHAGRRVRSQDVLDQLQATARALLR
jgi:tetratricopeptide (TPR) repeat protein